MLIATDTIMIEAGAGGAAGEPMAGAVPATVSAFSEQAAVLRLLTWMSPGFPVGAFAYSHGLEATIAEGGLRDGDGLKDWIATLLSDGSGWNDLVLFTEAYRAEESADTRRGEAVLELGLAYGGCAERRMETAALGAAFREASAPWRAGAGEASDAAIPYPVAVAIMAAEARIPLRPALMAFAHGFAANLVAAATRLVPLGQSEAMSVLHRLEPCILRAASRAEASTLDDLGSAAILSDIAAMRHETLATRLFRS